jgi:hypothetical protein
MGGIRAWMGRAWSKVRGFFGRPDDGRLYYFEEILPYEFAHINARRRRLGRPGEVAPIEPGALHPFAAQRAGTEAEEPREEARLARTPDRERRSPDPNTLFENSGQAERELFETGGPGGGNADPRCPDSFKMRPRPVPCDATGLAFSGGGIRSAAVCLGAMQALHSQGRLAGIDYLSTVSGGGYIGASLSAAMTRPRYPPWFGPWHPAWSPASGPAFPFGIDVADAPAVAHLRNYSNYLLPRGRSGLRNFTEATVIVLRGLVANAVAVLSAIFLLASVTQLLRGLLPYPGWALPTAGGALAALLVGWAMLRSALNVNRLVGDTSGAMLVLARSFLQAFLLLAVILLQPIAIHWLERTAAHPPSWVRWSSVQALAAALGAFVATVSAAAGKIGRFLETSRRVSGVATLLKRLASQAALVFAGLLLPLLLWIVYLWLCASPRFVELLARFVPGVSATRSPVLVYASIGGALWVITVFMRANAYSLHRFYRDRLSKAFLFEPPTAPEEGDPRELDSLKLSDLVYSFGPYHIINAAMNVQGSAEANRRGRNADFFMFSSTFVGSDLTFYAATGAGSAPTLQMERLDPRLDLGTAMAISGAAISANMGSSTVRILSPTLALLNVRLGYWLPNPRNLAARSRFGRKVRKAARALFERLFLLREMLNLHDEKSGEVFLTDGGHIENLGVYELLKRGCRLIVAVDAESDPTYSFSSLLKLERYARIDLGIRIALPWEEIADTARQAAAGIEAGRRPCRPGPHCAVGTIQYQEGAEGILVYFKASVTGDEKDYVLDYKRRNPSFPHETTGDQFFSEEQFEMYRALGFHMVDGFFSGSDTFACKTKRNREVDPAAVKALVDAWLPRMAYV